MTWLLVCVAGVVWRLTEAGEGNDTNGSCVIELRQPAADHPGVHTVLGKNESGILLILGFGGFSMILAFIYNATRKYFFSDENNVDSTFDAGGNVTFSLTAVTVASQLFWPGDILHSATLTVKNGIAGPFWYATGIMANIFIFPILSVNFKTRAPGAKTYLQIMRARFGKSTHIVFCCFALLTNIVITIGIILAGQATIQSLTTDASNEFVIIIMAVLFGSYSFIGGLGTTFYVSYFNAVIVFVIMIVFVVQIFYMGDSGAQGIGSISKVFDAVTCIHGPNSNHQNNFLTFRSGVAILYGVIEVFVSSAVTFCDQASWQSRIAAKPKQGVLGFILGGFMWFTIPATMATTTGIGYLALSYQNGTHLLDSNQITEGLVTPLVAERVLGATGGVMVLTMGTMALMSTGSGEVMAISSIIVYDIYQTYFRPFRKDLRHTQCVLCGKSSKYLETKEGVATAVDSCQCDSVADCDSCRRDTAAMKEPSPSAATAPHYTCQTHGSFREYQDRLFQFKNWCIVWVSLLIIPLGLLVFVSKIDLNWIFYEGSLMTVPCFPPVFLSIMWSKATGKGLVAGGISGLIVGIVVTLSYASTFPGGLEDFLLNTAQDFVILAGIASALFVSLTVSIVVSLRTHHIHTAQDENLEWQKTQLIDNPLNPWVVCYKEELKNIEFVGKPSFRQMEEVFTYERKLAYIAGCCSIAIVAIVIPSIMVIFPVFDIHSFTGWVVFCHIYAVVMAVIVIFLPPYEEVRKIMRHYRASRSTADSDGRKQTVTDGHNQYELTDTKKCDDGKPSDLPVGV